MQLKERFQFIIHPQKTRNKKQCAAFIVVVLSIVTLLSYMFIIQSAYVAPIEDIETSLNVQEIEDEEIIICQNNHDTYTMIIDGKEYEIDEQMAESYIEQGAKLIKE